MLHLSERANEYYKLFMESHDIEYWLSYFSICSWERLKFLYELGNIRSKSNETTITENLVYELAQIIRKDEIPIPIRLFHSPNEGVNGSDIEIIVQLEKNRHIIFPCQAKRLYLDTVKNSKNAKYSKLNYDDGKQKDKLINYAKKISGFPLYLLYNYSETKVNLNSFFPIEELYGCTLISALYLKEHRPQPPTFPNLHPPAKPLTSISKFRNFLSLNSLWGNTSLKHDAKLYSDKQIFGDKNWEELGSPIYHRFISKINLKEILKNNLNTISEDKSFNPSFRIVLTKEKIDIATRIINF